MKTGPSTGNNSDNNNDSNPNHPPTPVSPVVNTNAAAQPVSSEQLQQEQHRSGNSDQEKETFGQKMSRLSHNCWESTGLCCFTAKEQSQIAALEFQIVQRQKKFGVDYLTKVLTARQQQLNSPDAPQAPIAEALERCVTEAVSDIDLLQGQIDSRMVNIDQRTVQVNERLQPAPTSPQHTTAAAVLIDEGVEATPEHPPNAPPAAAFASVPNEDGNNADSGKESGTSSNVAALSSSPVATTPVTSPDTAKDTEKEAAM
ncbi:unnamed protein product [Cylindrotheca closterium]|uniref:Uncharacterized protein n=1 Tax=Cylindrotheca closterium TaxID=2856 RepID=A0AAD2FKG1_9STRA|nr:unnamed protein product [Cylindrotheca closterium]